MQREKRLDRITLFKEPKPNIDGIIVPFEKTPFDIVCPHFWELRWAYGCPYHCAYCYLQGTFRGNKEPRTKNIDEILFTLDNAFKDRTLEPSIFNSGELSDSLMNHPLLVLETLVSVCSYDC